MSDTMRDIQQKVDAKEDTMSEPRPDPYIRARKHDLSRLGHSRKRLREVDAKEDAMSEPRPDPDMDYERRDAMLRAAFPRATPMADPEFEAALEGMPEDRKAHWRSVRNESRPAPADRLIDPVLDENLRWVEAAPADHAPYRDMTPEEWDRAAAANRPAPADSPPSQNAGDQSAEEPRWALLARLVAPLIHDGLLDVPDERQIPDKAFAAAKALDAVLPVPAEQDELRKALMTTGRVVRTKTSFVLVIESEELDTALATLSKVKK